MASSISGKLVVKRAQLTAPTDIASLSTSLSLGELGLTYNSGATLGKLFVGSGNATEFGVFMDSQIKAAGGSVATGEVSSVGYLGTSGTTAGYLNSSTTAPSSTTRLNYNGNLHANSFLSSSDITVGTSSLSWTIDGTTNFVLKNSSDVAKFTLTSTGDLSSLGAVTATSFSGSGSSLTGLTAGNLSGTIPSGVLANSSVFIGTTSIALNRGTGSQSLTGVSVDGSSNSLKSTATTGVMRITGPATGTTRDKTVRDANDTILELGGSYVPTGNWDFTGQVEYTPTTLATTGTVNIDFSGANLRTQGDLTGNITYTASNYAAGRNVTIRVKNGGTQRTLTFPTNWVFLGTKPANIAASKTGVLSLTSFGTVEADVVAAWAVQA